MSDRLLIQSIGHAPDGYESWVDMTAGVMRRYASMCGADYEMFVGCSDENVHPTWNRVSRALAAFSAGYQKVVWLDVDTLVVNVNDSIFDGTDDTTPFHSVRILHREVYGTEAEYGRPGPDDERAYVENDGVLVMNNAPETVTALRSFWSQRTAENHEQTAFDAYVRAHPDAHRPLDPRYNWFDWERGMADRIDPGHPSRDEAVIVAWHAWSGARHPQMVREYRQVWG